MRGRGQDINGEVALDRVLRYVDRVVSGVPGGGLRQARRSALAGADAESDSEMLPGVIDPRIDVEAQFARAATMWNLDPNTPHKLAGIEIGSEGFGTVKLNVNFPNYSLTTGAPPPPPPPAQLSAMFIASSGTLPLTEAFTAHATGGTPPYSYNWDFGDGGTSSTQNPSHIYLLPGNYTVSLTATNSVGPGSTTKTDYITASIVPVLPAAQFTGTPQSGKVPAYFWDFGDGFTYNTADKIYYIQTSATTIAP